VAALFDNVLVLDEGKDSNRPVALGSDEGGSTSEPFCISLPGFYVTLRIIPRSAGSRGPIPSGLSSCVERDSRCSSTRSSVPESIQYARLDRPGKTKQKVGALLDSSIISDISCTTVAIYL
jgi:hypothetical protein